MQGEETGVPGDALWRDAPLGIDVNTGASPGYRGLAAGTAPILHTTTVVFAAGIENDGNLLLAAITTLTPVVLSPFFDRATPVASAA